MSNCINCGAPIDLKLDSCPYCDSPYGRDKEVKDLYQAALKAIGSNGRLYDIETQLSGSKYGLAYTSSDGNIIFRR